MAVRLLVKDTHGKDLYLFLSSAYAPVGNTEQASLYWCIRHFSHKRTDFKLIRWSYRARSGSEFNLPDLQYAYDTAVFTSLETEYLSILIDHFNKFGLAIHVGKPRNVSKTEILFVLAPSNMYTDANTFDNIDLSNLDHGEQHLPSNR